MKKELLLIERNTLLNRRNFTRNITRSEDHLSLLYLKQNTRETLPQRQCLLLSVQTMKVAKAFMLVHQYELFKMKDDESIEQMYSRFQTLVSGRQILKKSYVASDHVRKILRSITCEIET